jgi:osmoprotectant transport system permease protein
VITSGFYRNDFGKGLAGAAVVACVALVLELFAAAVQRAAEPRRQTRTARGGSAPAHAG